VGALTRAPIGPARSKTPDMHGTSTRENRETLAVPDPKVGAGRSRKVMSHKLDMNAGRESDGCVVPAKGPNKGGSDSPAEGLEGRRPTKENTGQTAACQMQSWMNALAGLNRVRQAAKRDKRLRFTALLHHVSLTLLANSFYALKRGAAPGVDGITWQQYEADLDQRLEDLHRRVHRGTYRALPSKRAYIPKPDGRQRPLGLAALEDKIVQHAVGTVLNQIYEEDFLGFSYGFRPGRSAHDALDALNVGILRKKVNWVLDADIRDCFGSFSHTWMVTLLQQRIGDRRILRLIKKWLRAGVLEDGEWSERRGRRRVR
jgi:RNA-directed DNA polymerase